MSSTTLTSSLNLLDQFMVPAQPSYNAALTSKFFRDTPNSGGGVPRSASSYSVQAPDMEDVKESVRQV